MVDADASLKHLSRHVYLNPLRAHMLKGLDDLKCSSYRALVGKIPPPAWLPTDWLLSLFAKRPKHAARNDQLFVKEVAWDFWDNPAKVRINYGFK